MSPRALVNIPVALSTARRQLDRWRSRQPTKRTRLPEDLWQNAVALARAYGLNKTASALGLKYESLKKHLQANVAATISGGTKLYTINSRTGYDDECKSWDAVECVNITQQSLKYRHVTNSSDSSHLPDLVAPLYEHSLHRADIGTLKIYSE
jgi:hypothetical protein